MPPYYPPPHVPPFKDVLPSHYLPLYFGALGAVLVGLVLAAWWRGRRRRAGLSTTPADGCLSVLLVCLLLVLAEGCFYRFVNLSDSFAASNMGRLWFWRNVHENNWGHRDNQDYTLRPEPGKTRIVFLGDSFTFGHGVADVEDRFANRIRRRLEAEAPGKFEVCVFSFPGWSTRREIDFLRPLPEVGLRADLVVLVYVPNDHVDIEGLAETDRKQRAVMQNLRPQALLLRKSYLANFLYYRFAVMKIPEVREYYDWARAGYESPYWEAHQRDLRTLQAYCELLGARLAVVTFPFLNSVGPDYPFADVHKKLDGFWKEQGVPHLDLLETFRQYEPSELMVNRFDAHPNVFAHRLAAERIYQDLLEPELLKGRRRGEDRDVESSGESISETNKSPGHRPAGAAAHS